MGQNHQLLTWIGRIIPTLLVALCLCTAVTISATAQTTDKALPFKLVPQTKIRISVVEWLAAEGEYKEWSAVGGEFTVGTDGKISVPLVGEINAIGHTPSEVANSISTALQSSTGLTVAPAVSAQIVAYPPVFVAGNVERPGEIEYRPGLTVMQAVALAGGRERRTDTTDRYSSFDQIRYAGELNRIDLQIVQQMARRSRLQAELDGDSEIIFAPEFEVLLNEPVIRQIKRTEMILFQARRDGLDRQIASLGDLGALLKKEIAVLDDKMAVQDRQIDVAIEELQSISKLYNSGIVTKSRHTSLGRLVADLQGNKLDMVVASMRAQQKLSETSRDTINLRAQRQTELSRELQDTESTLEDLQMKRATTRQLLRATGFINLENETRAGIAEQPLDYSVVRSSQTNRTTDIEPGDLLFPGDLLEVRFSIEIPMNSVALSAINGRR